MAVTDSLVDFRYPAGDFGLKAALESFGLRGSHTVLLLVVSLSVAVVSPYVKHVVSRLPPGLPRLCSVLPVLAFNTLAAVALDSEEAIVLKLVIVFVFTWLANFKLLAFCLNRGPLVGPWTTLQLAAILTQPIYPRPHRDTLKKDDAKLCGRLQDHAGPSQALFIRWLLKTVCFFLLSYALLNESLVPLVRECMQVVALYCFVGLLMDGPAAVLTHILDFDIIPTFDQPWLTVSLADFWGRRWNITTSHMLRALFYDPIVEGRLFRDPKVKVTRSQSPAVRATGTCCTFLVSGIVHELMFWALQPDGRVSWKPLIFFTIQGPFMIIENNLVDFARARGWKLNAWVAGLITQSFLMTLAHSLLLAAINTDTGTTMRWNKAVHHQFVNCWRLLSGGG